MTTKTQTTQLHARDIMTRDPITVFMSDSIAEVAQLLESNQISGVPVLDVHDRVVGIVSKTDILRRALEGPLGARPGTYFELIAGGLGEHTDLDEEELGSVGEFMSTDLVSVTPDATVREVARKMIKESVHRVVVLDGDKRAVGIITTFDVLRTMTA